MNYSNIINCDVANGVGVRVSLFVSGCTNHCESCFQPQTWDFDYGEPFTEETEDKIIDMLSKPHIDGLTLLGGEPFEPVNQHELVHLLRRVRMELPEKNVWCYTGFTFKELVDEQSYCHCDVTEDMLNMIDVLVDGRFVEELKDISLKFRGSSNQKIINLRETMRLRGDNGYIVVMHDSIAEELVLQMIKDYERSASVK